MAEENPPLVTLIRGSSEASHLILFLTGLSGNITQWELVIDELLDLPVSVAYGAPILPSPEFSGKPPKVTTLAQAISDELRAGPWPDIIVVAHSVGTFVGLGLARLLPQHVKAVVLVNGGLTTVARFLDRPVREMIARPRTCITALRLFFLVGTPVPKQLRQAIANSERSSHLVLGNLVSEEGLATESQRVAIMQEAGGRGVMQALWINRHHWREFAAFAAEIATPVVFLVGEEDPMSSAGDTGTMAAMLQHATVQMLPGVGHAAPAESPGLVAAAVREAFAETRET